MPAYPIPVPTPPVQQTRVRDQVPVLSVVIPTYRRPEALDQCLQGLAAQTTSTPFEVIVVDDGGGVPLDVVLDRHRDSLQLRVLEQGNRGPGAARNAGVGIARGELVAFTDDDCVPQPGWVESMLRAARADPEALLGGHTRNGLGDDAYAEVSQAILDAVYRYNDASRKPRFFASNNLVVPRQRYLELDGFDPRFRVASEDRDFCARWSAAGHEAVAVDDAVVDHRHRHTLSEFFRMHFRYGRGAHQHYRTQRHREASSPVDTIGSHLGFLRLLKLPSWRRRPFAFARSLVLVAIWQLANSSGFFYQAWRSRRDASS